MKSQDHPATVAQNKITGANKNVLVMYKTVTNVDTIPGRNHLHEGFFLGTFYGNLTFVEN